MTPIEVYLDGVPEPLHVGTLYRYPKRGGESVTFEYAASWLSSEDAFPVDPALPLGRGTFVPGGERTYFGAFGDCAPDTWGRRLMQSAARSAARREKHAVETLLESDYLLGVSDTARTGALRFKQAGTNVFLSPDTQGVPPLIRLGELLAITERFLRDDESDEDLALILAPGSSLGGARPKASILDQHGTLSIAKFPKESDEYSVERWELIALHLARAAGISVADHNVVTVLEKPVFISKRFDRRNTARIPYISALSMLELADGDRASYADIADVLLQNGSAARADVQELYRRMAFNVLISNVDDHLRNHGFLRHDAGGWRLSPAFDVNPTPADIKPRVLTTNITPDDGTCGIEPLLSVAGYFGLSQTQARASIKDLAQVVQTWRDVAKSKGAPRREQQRMESAFEHQDLRDALKL